jgi:hypothetical protein
MRGEAFCPANVAASISAVSRVAVATSALHPRQYFSDLPGSSNNASVRPHTLHCEDKSDLQQSGSISIASSSLALFLDVNYQLETIVENSS